MDWITSVLTVLALGAMAKKFFWAPMFGTLVQFWWVFYIVYVLPPEERGLLLSTLILLGVYAVAIPKWYRERVSNEN